MSSLLKVGITHGDVNGIGYEVLLKAFSDDRLLELFRLLYMVHPNQLPTIAR